MCCMAARCPLRPHDDHGATEFHCACSTARCADDTATGSDECGARRSTITLGAVWTGWAPGVWVRIGARRIGVWHAVRLRPLMSSQCCRGLLLVPLVVSLAIVHGLTAPVPAG